MTETAQKTEDNGSITGSATRLVRATRDAPPSYWVVVAWLVVSVVALAAIWHLSIKQNETVRACIGLPETNLFPE